MSYFWIWIYAAAVVGGIGGFFLCAILSANNLALNWGKEQVPGPLSLSEIVEWLRCQVLKDYFMREIVRLVYDGKRTIHKNPIRKKPAEKYPTSER